MKTLKQCCFFALVTFTVGVHAENDFDGKIYGEIGMMEAIIKFPDATQVKPKMAILTVGFDVSKNIAIEGVIASAFNKNERVGATMYSAFLKPYIEITDKTKLFAKVGLSKTNLNSAASGSINKFAYGIGVQRKISENLYGQIDYVIYGKNSESGSVRGLAFSIGNKF